MRKISKVNSVDLGRLNEYVWTSYKVIDAMLIKHRFVLLLTLIKMRSQTRRRNLIEDMHLWSMSERKI